jgi:hypothetical protein
MVVVQRRRGGGVSAVVRRHAPCARCGIAPAVVGISRGESVPDLKLGTLSLRMPATSAIASGSRAERRGGGDRGQVTRRATRRRRLGDREQGARRMRDGGNAPAVVGVSRGVSVPDLKLGTLSLRMPATSAIAGRSRAERRGGGWAIASRSSAECAAGRRRAGHAPSAWRRLGDREQAPAVCAMAGTPAVVGVLAGRERGPT